tara:strand:- start:2261 stop:3154 length:894 start_codon:yes stop_codon:yes gene_type:complete
MRIIFLFVLCFTLSCSDSLKTLPNSTGSNSEILFVCPDYLWENNLSKTVLDIFSQQIPGVASKESVFSVMQVNLKKLNSLLKSHTNIIIISSDSVSSFKNNLWANNQLVAYLNYQNDIKKFNIDCSNIYKIYYDKEISSLRRTMDQKSNSDYNKLVKDRFDIDLIVPKKYILTDDKVDFLQFSYNPQNMDVIKHILIYTYNGENSNQMSIFKKTNQILSQNLLGKSKNSYVVIEDEFPTEIYDGTYRTLWKLENGFMGGPIIIKPYFNGTDIVLVSALVFDPASNKRQYLKEFEAIL